MSERTSAPPGPGDHGAPDGRNDHSGHGGFAGGGHDGGPPAPHAATRAARVLPRRVNGRGSDGGRVLALAEAIRPVPAGAAGRRVSGAPAHAGGRRGRGGGAGAPGSGGPSGTGRAGRAPRPRRGRVRRILRALVLLVCLLIVASAGTYVWADTRLEQDVDLGAIQDRAKPGRGTNYLIVGSDSRAGLSESDVKDLHTGGSPDDGRRTDSMILLHTGAHGSTMTSLPRDSWVTIPPYVRPETGTHHPATKDKLNAAFSYGGPQLLVRTVERNTGLRVDHYAEMGFAGFVGIVDAVGGVRMCVDRDVRDEKSGLDLTKGCHTLDGHAALAFVRQRHQEAAGDLGRSRNQQKFLAALARKVATPDVALSPAKVYATMNAGLGSLIVDKGTDLPALASLFKAMKGVTAGGGRKINVPVASLGFPTSKGSAVKWDAPRAGKLFAQLRADRPVDIGAARSRGGESP